MLENFTQLIFIMPLVVAPMIAEANNEGWSKRIYFNKIETTRNPKYLQAFAVNSVSGGTKLDVYSNIIESYPEDFWMALIVILNPSETRRYHVMFEHHLQFCHLYGKRIFQRSSFIKMWIRDFIHYNNYSQNCPQPKGNYSWIGLPVDKLSIPKFIPSAKYEVKVRFYAREKSVNETISQVLLKLEVK